MELWEPSNAYKLVSSHKKNIFTTSTVNEIKQQFSKSIPENMKVLPTTYCIPKMHKLRIGNRFTIASKQYAFNALTFAINIAAAFKLLYKSAEKS